MRGPSCGPLQQMNPVTSLSPETKGFRTPRTRPKRRGGGFWVEAEGAEVSFAPPALETFDVPISLDVSTC